MMFVTLFYGVLHLDTGVLHYVNAGHNPPYLLRTDGVQPLARTGGMAVAVSEGMAYRAASVQLQPGEQLFLFTDNGVMKPSTRRARSLARHACSRPCCRPSRTPGPILAHSPPRCWPKFTLLKTVPPRPTTSAWPCALAGLAQPLEPCPFLAGHTR